MNFMREKLMTASRPGQGWGKDESTVDGMRSRLNFWWTLMPTGW